MKKAIILVFIAILHAKVLVSQNQFSIPKAQICIGAGLFGFGSSDDNVTACEKDNSYRPAGLFLLEYRIHKNVAIDIKSSFYKTVHHYGGSISSGQLGDDELRFCFKEFHNVYAIGPELRFIILAKHKFTIQPAFYVQKAKQFLYKTLRSNNYGTFEPSPQRLGYVNETFRILGTSLTLAYQITRKFGVSATGAFQKGGDEFGAFIGGTLDLSWSFYSKKKNVADEIKLPD